MRTWGTTAGGGEVSRYECKYYVSASQQQAIRTFITTYVTADPYAASRPGFVYPVYSLYLDSAELALYRMSMEGIRNRVKLRIRSYAADADASSFLEIKRRVGPVVLKRRARVDAAARAELLSAGAARRSSRFDLTRDRVSDEFATIMREKTAAALMVIRYQREAYESRDRDSVRITFDTELCYALAPRPRGDGAHAAGNGDGAQSHNSHPSLARDGAQTGESAAAPNGPWRPVALDGVILEIKFTSQYPTWVRALVEHFELVPCSIPKYALCVSDGLQAGSVVAAGAAKYVIRSRGSVLDV